jgi:c-di-GMP-binding flagellar brake protein YcgR
VSGPVQGTARGQVEARVLDLSAGGALLHLGAPLADGTIQDFVLHLEGDEVSVQAEVVRCRPTGRGGYQVAVQFVGIAPEHQKQLERYLARHS